MVALLVLALSTWLQVSGGLVRVDFQGLGFCKHSTLFPHNTGCRAAPD